MTNWARARMDSAIHMNDKTWYHTPAGVGDAKRAAQAALFVSLLTYISSILDRPKHTTIRTPCTRISTPNQTPYNPCTTNQAQAHMDPAVHMNDKTWYHTPAGAGDAKRAAQAALFVSLLTYIPPILDCATDITQARMHHHPNPLHPHLNTKPNPIQPPYDKPGMSPYGPCYCATDITQARMHHHPNPLHPRLDTEPNPIQPPYNKLGTSPYGPRCPHERQNTVPHPCWSGLRDTHHPSLNAPRPEPSHPCIDTEPNPIRPPYDKPGTSPYGPHCPHEQQNTVPHTCSSRSCNQHHLSPNAPSPEPPSNENPCTCSWGPRGPRV
ncbi:hypothetical protein BS47DRAFT_1367300 [Hydnum rufescens UP504]|uniref:Uncharacterized protein n=1 Tax=Hydnum rufescens UP504 TaxID=1448309 RepID=A0A9P6AKM5_9AGAM|nr:hypothetical protein BS47DRAFT_1367300 [Hydnum rufescens UP504]